MSKYVYLDAAQATIELGRALNALSAAEAALRYAHDDLEAARTRIDCAARSAARKSKP